MSLCRERLEEKECVCVRERERETAFTPRSAPHSVLKKMAMEAGSGADLGQYKGHFRVGGSGDDAN